ncbi:signal transduction histidine kinase [Aquimarina sp. MAR_2010_214]|uniref:ATP-binding protein n=1 Tax=Aquimarina sp. MAR_2010_214 TaxID=1250026 RepID=UPI000C702C2C|nr:tetratricopeptide repeat protein [Aquimarina sp. MAR_2010_214]PKV49901.1 signal transduction histidine kinase [Aquimarina sp. MAR_2010_214]
MLRFLLKLFTVFLFFCSIGLYAQVKEKETPLSHSESKTYTAQEKIISQAFQDLDTKKDRTAYIISHKILKETKYRKIKLQAYINLGVYFNERNLGDSALFYGNKTLQIIGKRNDSIFIQGKSFAYNIIALSYAHKGLFEEAKKWHLKGLEIVKKFKTKRQYYVKLHNLAMMELKLGNYDDSIKLFKTCLEYKEKPDFTFMIYNNLANAYASKDNYKVSMSYLKKSLDFFKNKEASRIKTSILQNIGALYHLMGDYDKAIEYYYKAYPIAKETEFHRALIDILTNIGLVYQDKKKYSEAKKSYDEALSISEKLGFLDKQIIIYNNLKEAAVTQKNYKDAYLCLKKEIKIKDSISKLQKSKDLNELEVKFNTLQKEKEIKVLQVENANRKLDLGNQEEAIKNLKLQQEIEKKETQNKILSFQNASEKKLNEIRLLKKDQEIQESKLARQKSIKNSILYSFLVLLIPVIGLLFTYYQKLQAQSELNKKQEEISEQKISSLIKDQELKLIKASIKGQDKERKRIALELHDSIGGNLAAIKLQLNNTVLNGNRKTITTINNQLDDTYEQVRNLSHNLIPKKFSKNNFCDVLEEYFNNIGGTTSLSTFFVAYPRTEIDLLDETLQIEIFKIVQELITNTIKHAKATSVELQLNLVENMINVLFEDNGIGFNAKNKATGLGFENIKNRLKKISGTFHIDSRINRGTIIDIEVPALTAINGKVSYRS